MKSRERNRILQIAAGLILAVAFFLPWMRWQQQPVRGLDLPTGTFFSLSESRFRLANPFPQLDFSLHVFWLIPLLSLTSVLLSWRRQRNSWPALTAGMLTLAQLTVFYLFSATLCDLGVDSSALRMVRPAAVVTALAAAGVILTSDPLKGRRWKLVFLLSGPLLAYGAYKYGEARVMNETFTATTELKPDHVITATDLLREFTSNDSLANARYREKIIAVTGVITQVNRNADSTTTLQLADSTGSYLIFDFEPEQYRILSALKTGDIVSLKGSCSGSIYSEILGTTSIAFKRSTLNKK